MIIQSDFVTVMGTDSLSISQRIWENVLREGFFIKVAMG